MKFDIVLDEIIKEEDLGGIRIAITMCSSRDMKPQTGLSLANLLGYLVQNHQALNLTKLDIIGGVAESLLSAARQRKLDFALSGNYTHVAMFDDDMVFPFDAVHKMLAHNKDFVCANVCQKVPGKISGVCLDLETQTRMSHRKKGLEEVSFGTLACTLIKLDLIRKIPKPHFEVVWEQTLNNGLGSYRGEDHYFMQKLKNAGMKLYCDHDLTRSVQHVGDFPYQFPQNE